VGYPLLSLPGVLRARFLVKYGAVVFQVGVLAMFVTCPLHLGYKLLSRIGLAKKA
jgi:hypothetical protein